MHSGFYGMSMKAVKPTDDCFGPWVYDSAHELINFGWDLTHNISHLTYSESETAAYDVVDLIFRNDEYCHFRQTFWDIYNFCKEGENCTGILANIQTNAFSLITQVSSSIAVFKAQPWAEMDVNKRAYVMNSLGHSQAQVVADIIGFTDI